MEILTTVPIYTHPWIYNFLLAAAVLIIVGGIASCLTAFEVLKCTPALVGLILIVIGFFGIVHTTDAIKRTSVLDYNTYEVILDDSISVNEFMNTYEVLEQRGQIYVVREIEE